jgi:UDP-glucose 4-epimerase
MKQTVLVTGGAGYIGSHTVRMLVKQGFGVVVLDNLVYGHREAIVDKEVVFVEGDISDKSLIVSLIKEHSIQAVLHFAAFAYVGESVVHPAKYYENNLIKSIAMLDAMLEAGCQHLIFSSTCATYGNPQYMPIDEKHPQAPINAYGASKWMFENVVKDYARAYDLKYVFLRYFNAAGCSEDGLIGEDHQPETHLIPLILKAIKGERENITVFGTDYDTPDGTCLRDYIHVNDLANAHIKALDYLTVQKESLIVNLGTGNGYSVNEMIQAAEKVSGLKVPVVYGERRAGDPAQLVADATLAKEKLGWVAQYHSIEQIIQTAWQWENGARKGRYNQ